jgi:ribosomal RNA-processing protein 12
LLVIFDSLLSFSNHTKPKIRKASQHAICAVLRGSYFMLGDNPPDSHPAAARYSLFSIIQYHIANLFPFFVGLLDDN